MMTRRRSTPSCAKIACCISPVRPAAQVCVEIGTPGRLLGPRGRAQDVLDHRRHAGGVGGALDDGRLHAAVADALRDVADEQVGHRVDAVRAEVALRHPPDAGGDDDVHARAARHAEDQVDVAAEIDGGQVDDRADAAAVEVGHLPLGDVEDRGAIPQVGPVLLHARRARDDVLVHQRRSELGRGHRTERCLHRCHATLPPGMARPRPGVA